MESGLQRSLILVSRLEKNRLNEPLAKTKPNFMREHNQPEAEVKGKSSGTAQYVTEPCVRIRAYLRTRVFPGNIPIPTMLGFNPS
jgi:hypothetical protein